MTIRILLAMITAAALLFTDTAQADDGPQLTEIEVVSTLDGTKQPSLIWVPEIAKSQPTPLFVFLHSWSADYRQKNTAWQREAVERGWMLLHPNFRGQNNHPQACGSALARQDVLDAIDYVLANYRVDRSRIYLAGSSGGGHMAMLMAGYHPQRFSAVSAWVGISHLADWHAFHTKDGQPQRYARMIEASLDGPPGKSPKIDAEYQARSPIFHLHNVGRLPIDLNAGVRDGHDGSVPIYHTLKAFNVIARTGGFPPITDTEMDQLWTQGRLTVPKPSDKQNDASYGRDILLRRHAGPARVTIFDGGHESIARAGCAWLAQQSRLTRTE